MCINLYKRPSGLGYLTYMNMDFIRVNNECAHAKVLNYSVTLLRCYGVTLSVLRSMAFLSVLK